MLRRCALRQICGLLPEPRVDVPDVHLGAALIAGATFLAAGVPAVRTSRRRASRRGHFPAAGVPAVRTSRRRASRRGHFPARKPPCRTHKSAVCVPGKDARGPKSVPGLSRPSGKCTRQGRPRTGKWTRPLPAPKKRAWQVHPRAKKWP